MQCGIKTAALDVKTLLRHVLEKDDVYLITHNLDLISNSQYQKFRRLIRRRKRGEPVAYLTGHKEFFGLDFVVNKNVLIPRPETEVLVERAIEHIKAHNSRPRSIVDIGTGSGCIILSIIKNLPPESFQLKSYAVDISSTALKVAKHNAKNLGLYDNIRFLKSDLLHNPRLAKKFDLIIANLPYLTFGQTGKKTTSVPKSGLDFEPSTALYAPDQGFAVIERLMKDLPQRLKPEGMALLEVDESHLQKIAKLCHGLGLKSQLVENPSQFKGFVRISF